VKYFITSRSLQSGTLDVKALIETTRVSDIMSKTVSTTTPWAAVEEAAKAMHELRVRCLPVISDERVVGIITRSDVYRAFVDITGIKYGGNRIFLSVEDRPGSIREVTDRVRKYGFRLQSILTSYEGAAEGYRKLVVRTKGSGDIGSLRQELEQHHGDVVIQTD
jgi:acetoin utilization protein AcuB